MKPLELCLTVWVSTTMGLISISGNAATGPELSQFTIDKHGVVLNIWVPTHAVAWKDMSVLLQITNTSSEKVPYYWIYELGGFRFSLADQEGNSVPMTQRGRLVFRDLTGQETKCSGAELTPGGKVEYQVKLSDYFLLSKPGICKLSVVWNSDPVHSNQRRNTNIESRDIHFTVSKL